MKRLLACIDASNYAVSVTEAAAWASRRLGAEVEVLHVIQRNDAVAARHDLSGAMGLGAKSTLLAELVAIDEAEGKLVRERGRLLLEAAAARLREGGVAHVEELHRHGGFVETVVEREEHADLVVIGKRGASANYAKGHLGAKIERVVRESTRPVLVASAKFNNPTRAALAFDGGSSSRKAAEFMANSKLIEGLELHAVCAGEPQTTAREWLAETLPDAEIHVVSPSPEESLPSFVESKGIDLLIMGAYGHSPLRRLIVGSTTTALLQRCRIPVLLFR